VNSNDREDIASSKSNNHEGHEVSRKVGNADAITMQGGLWLNGYKPEIVAPPIYKWLMTGDACVRQRICASGMPKLLRTSNFRCPAN
jgi:hypothetical protein